ncbi:hypothetical protein [Rubellicoccus peritrichatus]|uniref:Big-1 domain-containing protein n=1 Tax=Rubellicoccus peritrichatus TaxID=3080537 RepID=A0AAQ3LC25_9BACT|nr:hypothetical protein [Puniceicoccus sp. CR14]WOO43334.1 hypothetical protein RZN69_09560 [Puniceicoccus sp. CR14]
MNRLEFLTRNPLLRTLRAVALFVPLFFTAHQMSAFTLEIIGTPDDETEAIPGFLITDTVRVGIDLSDIVVTVPVDLTLTSGGGIFDFNSTTPSLTETLTFLGSTEAINAINNNSTGIVTVEGVDAVNATDSVQFFYGLGQTLTFDAIENVTFTQSTTNAGKTIVALNASVAEDALNATITFTVESSPPGAGVITDASGNPDPSGAFVRIDSIGTIEVTATSARTDDYLSTTRTQTFEVEPAPQFVEFVPVDAVKYGEYPFTVKARGIQTKTGIPVPTGSSVVLSITSGSGILGPQTVGIDGFTTAEVTVTGAGAISIQALASANGNFSSASDVQTVSVEATETSTGALILDQWAWRNPQPTPDTNSFNDFVFADDLFVAVGDSDGTDASILTSSDGVVWTDRSGLVNQDLLSVTYGAGTFVAVGSSGTVLSSLDGLTWSTETSGTAEDLNGVTYNAFSNTFVAVGASNTIITSPDGMTWNSATSVPAAIGTLNAVVANASGRLTAVGEDSVIISDDNGDTWSIRLFGLSVALNDVIVDSTSGAFVAVGDLSTILISELGNTWGLEFTGSNFSLTGISEGNGYFVAVGSEGKLVTSPDLETWTQRTSRFEIGFQGVGFGGGSFVAVGDGFTVFSSPIGEGWTLRDSGFEDTLEDIAFGNNLYVAVGTDAKILTSTDGIVWEDNATLPGGFSDDLYGVTFGGGTFVAVGSSGSILTSADGLTWVEALDSGLAAGSVLRDIVFSDNLFVAVGSDFSILSSSDGDDWDVVTSGAGNNFNAVAAQNGRFVAVGDDGVIYISDDGASWGFRFSGTNKDLEGVTSDGVSFVAVGDEGTVLFSGSGDLWTGTNSGVEVDMIAVVASPSGVFAAVGEDFSILTSRNGVDWSSQITGSLNSLRGVGFGNDLFVAVGDFESILTSSDIISSGLDSWSFANPVIDGTTVNDMLFAGGRFVAVGDGGLLLTSEDGQVWAEVDSGTTNNLNAVSYGSNTYIVVGENVILRSNDGAENWTTNINWLVDFQDVEFSDGRFVTVGLGGTGLVSSNLGLNWSILGLDIQDADMFGLTVGGGYWIAVGGPYVNPQTGNIGVISESASMSAITISKDGINWTRRLSPLIVSGGVNYYDNILRDVQYGNGIFLAAGDNLILKTTPAELDMAEPIDTIEFDPISGDVTLLILGSRWTTEVVGFSSWQSIAYGEPSGSPTFVLVNDVGGAFTTESGDDYVVSFPGISEGFTGVAFGDGEFIASAQNGRILSSPDGDRWTVRSTAFLQPLNAVSSTGPESVAVGDNGIIFVSNTPGTWTAATDSEVYPVSLNATVYGNGRHVAVGDNGWLMTSSDGNSWTPRISNLSDDLHGVTFGEGTLTNGGAIIERYVAVGANGAVAFSADGTTWNTVTESEEFNAIANGNGTYVAVGENASILTTTDGAVWADPATIPSSIQGALNGVSFGNGTFVAVGQAGQITYSNNNGVDWNVADSGLVNDLQGIVFGDGFFVAVGFDGSIVTSADGVDWRLRPSGSNNLLNGVGFREDTFTSVGTFSTILESQFANRLEQVISFNPIPNQSLGTGPIPLSAVASSGLPITYFVVAGSASIQNGNQLVLSDSATIPFNVTVRATQSGDDEFASATPVDQTFSVVNRLQTIDFPAISDVTFQDVTELSLVAVSRDVLTLLTTGLPITYEVLVGPATLSDAGNTLIITGAGEVTVRASQAGDDIYATAESVNQTFTIEKANQAIAFPEIPDRGVNQFPFLPTATSFFEEPGGGITDQETGLDVVYSITSGAAKIENNRVVLDGATSGQTITIQADQPGSNNYNAATSQTQTVMLVAQTQTVSWTNGDVVEIGLVAGTVEVPATSSEGTAITYSVDPSSAAFAEFDDPTDPTLTLLAIGSARITATAAASGGGAPEASVSQTIVITGEAQTITFPDISDKFITDPKFILTASASSGLDVVYTVTGGSDIVSVSGNEVTILGTGTGRVSIEASQPGNSQFNAAVPVTQTFEVVDADLGDSWTEQNTPVTTNLTHSGFINELFFAAGDGSTILTATDAVAWTSRSGGNSALLDIAAGGTPTVYVAVGADGIPLKSADGVNWQLITSPIGTALNAVVFAAGRFVAVGEDGFIAVSFDGSVWTTITTNFTADLRDIIFVDDRLIAVGENTAAVSNDFGQSWSSTVLSSSEDFQLNSVTAGGGLLMAVGNGFTVIVSSDNGDSWLGRSGPSDVTNDLNGVAFGANRFVVVGSDGAIYTTDDTLSWDERASGTTQNLNDVNFVSDIFVAVGNEGTILTSGGLTIRDTQRIEFDEIIAPVDGSSTTTLHARSIAGSGGLSGLEVRFDIIEGDAVISNTQLTAGDETTAVLTLGDTRGVVVIRASQAGNDDFYAAANQDQSITIIGRAESPANAILTGPGFMDLWTWRNPSESTTDFLNDIAIGPANDQVVAVGTLGKLIYSPDGSAWTDVDLSGLTTEDLNGVTSSSTTYVAVGDSQTIILSSDGINWDDTGVDVSSIPNLSDLHSVAYGSGSFIAVGIDTSDNGIAITSPDGLVWTEATAFPTTPPLNRITYNESLGKFTVVGDMATLVNYDVGLDVWSLIRTGTGFIDYNGVVALVDGTSYVVGDNGTILVSTDSDLQVWTSLFSGTDYELRQIVNGNGMLVAVGEDGRVLTALENGNEFWTESVTRFPLDMSGLVLYADGFIAVGQNYSVLTGTSGLDWTMDFSSQRGDLEEVAGNDDAIVSVGEDGRILRSTDSGETWVVTTSTTAEDLNGLAVNGTQFIAVGDNGIILSSIDSGATWAAVSVTAPFSPGGFDSNLNDIIYDSINGVFIAVGDDYSILVSNASGTSFTQTSIGANDLNGIGYSSTSYVIAGDDGILLTSTNGVDWLEKTSGTDNDLYDVAFGEGLYVVVGDNGRILTSETGNIWEIEISSFTGDIRGVTHADGVFVAVGQQFTFLASENGKDWQSQVSGTLNFLNGVAEVNGLFVAVGDFDTILTANTVIPTGLDLWSLRNPVADGDTINDVVYGNDSFVAVGDNGKILTSTDGENWISREVIELNGDPLTENLQGVAYGNGIYLAVGGQKLVSSSNAINWNVITTWTVPVNSVTFGEGLFVVTGDESSIFYSSNGLDWAGGSVNGVHNAAPLNDAVYDPDIAVWVVVGDAADFFISPDDQPLMSQLFVSFNGFDWTRVRSPFLEDGYYEGSMNTVSVGNGVFRAYGDGGLFSANGLNWAVSFRGGFNAFASLYTVGNGQPGFIYAGEAGAIAGQDPNYISYPGISDAINGLAFGEGTYVAVGANGRILNSNDGRNWSVRSAQNLSALNGLTVNSSGFYVAVGDGGTVYSSPDSIAWTISTVPDDKQNTAFFDVTSTPTQFVAVGENGSIITSVDGDIWGSTTAPVFDDLLGVTYGPAVPDDLLVAVGRNGAVILSLDGSSWIRQTSGTTEDLYDISLANDLFVAVGTNGTVITSPDGETWTDVSISGIGQTLMGVGYGQIDGIGIWLVAGSDGVLYATDDITSSAAWQPLVSGTISPLFDVTYGSGNFFVSGGDGTVITSNDLDDWFSRPTNTDYSLNAVAFFNDIFTVVGDFGTIITSGDIPIRSDQSIIFLPIPDQIISTTTVIAEAAATSDLPVTFSIIDGPATVSGNVITLQNTVGIVTVQASQAGSIRFNPAVPQLRTFEIRENEQTITFLGETGSTPPGSIDEKTFGDDPFEVRAVTSDTNLFPIITVVSGPASINNLTEDPNNGGVVTAEVTLIGAGEVVLQASQPGDSTTNPAEPVQRSFDVEKGAQTITFPGGGPYSVGDPAVTLEASSTSGLTISYEVISGPGDIVNGDQLEFTASGQIVVQATQPGDDDYNPAQPISQTFIINPELVGNNWTAQSSGTTAALNGVNIAIDRFIASGDASTLISSLSANTWTVLTGGTGALRGLAAGGDPTIYVAVGDDGVPLTSSNGLDWQSIVSPVSGVLNDIIFADGRFIGVGNSGLVTISFDGLEWSTIRSDVTSDLTGIAYNDGILVAVGGNQIAISDDSGANWTVRTFSDQVELNSVGYGNGMFVAVGDAFQVLTSSDSGVSWSVRPAAASNDLRDITFGANRFIAVGSLGGVFTSSNAIEWIVRDSGTTDNLNGIAFIENVFVIVGDSGTVLSSGLPTTKSGQTIDFDTISDPVNNVTTLTATAISDDTSSPSLQPVSFNIIEGQGTITNVTMDASGVTTGTLTVSGTPGNITVRASQMGGENFYVALNADQTLSISGDTQSVADLLPAEGELVFSTAPYILSASSVDSSTDQPTGLDVDFELVSGSATVSDNVLTLNADSVGTNVVVRAFNSGNSTYEPLSQTITYNIVEETGTIIFEKIDNKLLTDDDFFIIARTSNGEDVNIRIIEGSDLISLRTFVEVDLAGNQTLRHQVGIKGTDGATGLVRLEAFTTSANSISATPVTESFFISRFTQNITFGDVGTKTFGDGDFDINATADGGGVVTLAIADTTVATLDGTTVSIQAAGVITITATAAASSNGEYGPAEAELMITVAKAPQELQFEAIEDQFAVAGTIVNLQAQTFINGDEQPASPTEFPIVFSIVVGQERATISGSVLTLNGTPGTVTVQALQAGNGNVDTATAIQRTFAVSTFGKVELNLTTSMNGSAFGNNRHVAVGQQGAVARSIISTDDPTRWQFVASPTSNDLTDVAFGNDRFVAVGGFGTALTSSDGADWSSFSVGQPNLLNAVAFGDGQFVTVTAGGIGFNSTTGQTWSQFSIPTLNPLNDVAFGQSNDGGPQFVAVGPTGTIVTSSDGSNWTLRDTGTQLTLNGVTYGDGLFVVVADSRTYLFSQNGGVTWQRRVVPLQLINDGVDLNSISFGISTFRVVGADGLVLTATTEAIIQPTNLNTGASNWVKGVSLGTDELLDISFGGNRFVTVGDAGTILISLPELSTIFSAASSAGGTVMWSDWFGFFDEGVAPWIYHYYMGWLYVLGTENNMWSYSPTFGWIWTAEGTYPWFVQGDTGTWYLYAEDSVNPSLFYNSTTQEWEAYN